MTYEMEVEMKYILGQMVETPNGLGIYEGKERVGDAFQVLVRHVIRNMTGSQAGECVTPKAKIQGLWRYEAGLVTFPSPTTGRGRNGG
jgi:hypothetical protein